MTGAMREWGRDSDSGARPGADQRPLVALISTSPGVSDKLQSSVSASGRNIKANGWRIMTNGDTWNRLVQEERHQSHRHEEDVAHLEAPSAISWCLRGFAPFQRWQFETPVKPSCPLMFPTSCPVCWGAGTRVVPLSRAMRNSRFRCSSLMNSSFCRKSAMRSSSRYCFSFLSCSVAPAGKPGPPAVLAPPGWEPE